MPNESIIAKEGTPLVTSPDLDEGRSPARRGTGQATVWETTLNLMKTCMGTGTLALPFAAQQGGLILHTGGMLVIACWNIYSVHRLCEALQYLKASNGPRVGAPPNGTSTFGKVAWFAFGKHGVHGFDFALVLLFCGILTAYEDAVLGFLQDTPLNTGYLVLDALLIALVVGSLSLVPDMGYLAKASAFGLSVLLFSFTTIALYAPPREAEDVYTLLNASHLSWWPQDGITGISHWFGCVVFGFGVVPLTYNYYESMAQPQHLQKATTVALLGVALCYMLIGVGLLWLYYPVEGDILQQLPPDGLVPLIVRCSMIVVIILTCPLLVLPCGMILEGKLSSTTPTTKTLQAIIRYSICIACAIISVGVPGFVYVLSFVGCFSVGLVGFVIPPLLHITLVLQYESPRRLTMGLLLDAVMLLWGIFSTMVSSVYTFRQLYSNSSS